LRKTEKENFANLRKTEKAKKIEKVENWNKPILVRAIMIKKGLHFGKLGSSQMFNELKILRI
jgi:primosomal protein N'